MQPEPQQLDIEESVTQGIDVLRRQIEGHVGITTLDQEKSLLDAGLDGVMVGREAYHNPWSLASWDADFFGAAPSTQTRETVEVQMCNYMTREFEEHATPHTAIARHMLGLRHSLPGSRRWRQVWSDHRLKGWDPHEVMALAHQGVAVAELADAEIA
jgi:tRNA-dihydrouridine synthase A